MARIQILDDQLVNQAVELGGHKTKRAAATAALEEYIKSRKRVHVSRVVDRAGLDLAKAAKGLRHSGKKGKSNE